MVIPLESSPGNILYLEARVVRQSSVSVFYRYSLSHPALMAKIDTHIILGIRKQVKFGITLRLPDCPQKSGWTKAIRSFADI